MGPGLLSPRCPPRLAPPGTPCASTRDVWPQAQGYGAHDHGAAGPTGTPFHPLRRGQGRRDGPASRESGSRRLRRRWESSPNFAPVGRSAAGRSCPIAPLQARSHTARWLPPLPDQAGPSRGRHLPRQGRAGGGARRAGPGGAGGD